MNMVEVDPMLFIKCRLCLSETGQYQIAPNVQMQIKYCFDIDVQLFDGLSQLICKKCESILSQYTGIKQFFQEKQKHLVSKLRSNINIDNTIQQQHKSASFAPADNGYKKRPPRIMRDKRKTTTVPTKQSSLKSATFKTNRSKGSKIKWQSPYTKYFVCRFCAKSFKDKIGISNHIHKQCRLYTKYSNINKSFCLVELNKVGTKCNITGSIDKIVCNENKIIKSQKASYYILYTKKPNYQNDLSDSDENFVIDNKKHKRKYHNTKSSKKSIAIEQNTANSFDHKTVTKVWKQAKDTNVFQAKHERDARLVCDNECVNKKEEDPGNISTKPNGKKKDICAETPFQEKSNTSYDKIIEQNTANSFDNKTVTKAWKQAKDTNVLVAKHERDARLVCDNECVNKKEEDPESISTKPNGKKKEFCAETPFQEKSNTSYDKIISSIIARCSNKYLNRFNLSEGGNTTLWQGKSSCEHKIDSIESYDVEFSITSLLRFINQKNLEVVWLPKIDMKVTIKTRLKENQDSYKNDISFENITSLSSDRNGTEDFVLVFERISKLDSCVHDEIEGQKYIQQLNTDQQCSNNVNEKEQEDFALLFEGISELEACINKNVEKQQPIEVNTACRENETEKDPTAENIKKHKMQIIEKISNNDSLLAKLLTSVNASESTKNDNIALHAKNDNLRNVLNMDRNSTKLLNTNPVANPKKLPKKNLSEMNSNVKIYSDEPKNVSEIIEPNDKNESYDMVYIPCKAMRLPPLADVLREQTDVVCSNKNANKFNNYNRIPQSTLPKIQCKPISELMSDKALHLQNNSFVSSATTNWRINNENQSQNFMLQTSDSNQLFNESDQFTNVNSIQQDLVYYPQGQNNEALVFNPIENRSGSAELVQNRDTFNMHFVGLANTGAKATFRYFKNNIHF